jgi:TRAP-type mannitol/chloroaromatic compound transport system permease small subunit
MPFALFLLIIAWNYVARAWAIGETSMDPGGLPLVWLLKTLIRVLGAQLLLQGLVEIRHALRKRQEATP